MLQLIAFIIFIISFSVLILILYKKIPALSMLPHNGHHGFRKPKIFRKIEKKIKDMHFHLFEKQLWLHRLLSWTKVRVLRIETKIDHLLHSMRKKAQNLDKKVKNKK